MMDTVLTLVAATALSDDDVAALGRGLMAPAVEGGTLSRLGSRAVEVHTLRPVTALRGVVEAARKKGFDAAALPAAGRAKKVLICDMDSTIIEQECLDELADVAGIGAEIAAITERAMRGELDFEGALIERVSRLEGLDASAIEDVLTKRLTLSPGAETLVRTMTAHGARTALVSGGFTVFTGPIAERAGFAEHRGNTLEIGEDGRLTGSVIPPILGKDAKKSALLALCEAAGNDPSGALAMGDGANDLAMIETAGLGIAYRAKPVVGAQADAAIDHTDLTAALYFQGYSEAEFA